MKVNKHQGEATRSFYFYFQDMPQKGDGSWRRESQLSPSRQTFRYSSFPDLDCEYDQLLQAPTTDQPINYTPKLPSHHPPKHIGNGDIKKLFKYIIYMYKFVKN